MAKKRPGPYVGLSANYADDEKIMMAGEDAELLYIRMLAYAARTPLTEGLIADSVLRSRLGIIERDAYDDSGNVTGKVPGTDAVSRAEKLLEVGLISRTDSGWLINSWLRWNRSVEEMGKERRSDQKRKSRLTSSSAETAPETGTEGTPDNRPFPPTNDQDQDQDHSAGSADKPKTRATQFPESFTITDSHRAKAKEFGVNPDWEVQKFENHHRAKGSTFKDWSRAFHTWLTNAAEFQGNRPATGAQPAQPPSAEPERFSDDDGDGRGYYRPYSDRPEVIHARGTGEQPPGPEHYVTWPSVPATQEDLNEDKRVKPTRSSPYSP